MHRADMVDVFVRHIPSFCKIHFSKRLHTYIDSSQKFSHHRDTITLQFEDGTIAHADVLIGADGIRSATRENMYNISHTLGCISKEPRTDCDTCRHSTPFWTGTVVYRSLIPTDKLINLRPDHRALNGLLCVRIFAGFEFDKTQNLVWISVDWKKNKVFPGNFSYQHDVHCDSIL